MTQSHSDDKTGKSERSQRIAARKAHIKSLMPTRPMIRVEPTKDDYRKYLSHPNGTAFPQGSGSVEWPHDRFTKRRIKDGSVKVAEKKQDKAGEQKPQDGERQRHHRSEPVSSASN
jgi:hypothetical protein